MMNFKGWLLENEQYLIYCDLDGVLVDLETGVTKISGPLEQIPGKSHRRMLMQQVVKLTRKGISEAEFWAELPWTIGGQQLWDYISRHNAMILTGGTGSSGASQGKIAWCQKNLGIPPNRIIVTKASDKAKWATPNSILIDDWDENINAWNQAGGIGIIHTNSLTTIQQLKKLGL